MAALQVQWGSIYFAYQTSDDGARISFQFERPMIKSTAPLGGYFVYDVMCSKPTTVVHGFKGSLSRQLVQFYPPDYDNSYQYCVSADYYDANGNYVGYASTVSPWSNSIKANKPTFEFAGYPLTAEQSDTSDKVKLTWRPAVYRDSSAYVMYYVMAYDSNGNSQLFYSGRNTSSIQKCPLEYDKTYTYQVRAKLNDGQTYSGYSTQAQCKAASVSVSVRSLATVDPPGGQNALLTWSPGEYWHAGGCKIDYDILMTTTPSFSWSSYYRVKTSAISTTIKTNNTQVNVDSDDLSYVVPFEFFTLNGLGLGDTVYFWVIPYITTSDSAHRYGFTPPAQYAAKFQIKQNQALIHYCPDGANWVKCQVYYCPDGASWVKVEPLYCDETQWSKVS